MNKRFSFALGLSLLWHLVVFSGIGITFPHLQLKGPAKTNFLGGILQPADFKVNPSSYAKALNPININLKITNFSNTGVMPRLQFAAWKPRAGLDIDKQKSSLIIKVDSVYPRKQDSAVVMLYPRLPKHFLIYFKDRQKIHMELAFFITPSGTVKLIKRKISSGNLEADLLAQRYITHWLYLQRYNFNPNTWQSVKIDLEING